jgi:hypothetical protein
MRYVQDSDVEVFSQPVEGLPHAGVGDVGDQYHVALLPAQGLCQSVDGVGGVLDDVDIFGRTVDVLGDEGPRFVDEPL